MRHGSQDPLAPVPDQPSQSHADTHAHKESGADVTEREHMRPFGNDIITKGSHQKTIRDDAQAHNVSLQLLWFDVLI